MADLIAIEITQDSITQAFAGLIGRTSDFSSITRQIAQDLVTQTAFNFQNESGPDSSGQAVPWKKSQRAIAESGQTLTDKGILRRSVFPSNTPFTASIAAGVEYGAIHQFGGETGRGKKTILPARPFLPFGGPQGDVLQVDVLAEVIDTISAYIAKQ